MSDERLRRAAQALRQARMRIEELEAGRSEPIAIVSAACRFPGAPDLAAYRTLIEEGGCALRDAGDRFGPSLQERAGRGARWLKTGGFLDDVFDFDAGAFGISDEEAAVLDPQHRLLLEVAAAAVEGAGSALLRGRDVGIWCGLSTHEYGARTVRDDRLDAVHPLAGPGNAGAAAVGRVAYHLGLRGPAVVVDTACSSSLVAVHEAMCALRLRTCDAALAAGVNVVLSASVTLAFARLGVLSPTGTCRPFDPGADGYVRGEGCGVVVLKRLSDARRDGDPVLAVLRGSAINSNGGGNGLTAPRRDGQIRVMRAAVEWAGIRPEEVGYVEAFGSATPLGDQTELAAIRAVYGDVPFGSAKAHLGHLEAASGMAGLLRALLVVRSGGAGIAGVSAFGFGGTNAHVVLSEAEPADPVPAEEPHLLALSADDAEALAHREATLPDVDPAVLSRTLAASSPRRARKARVGGEPIAPAEGPPVLVVEAPDEVPEPLRSVPSARAVLGREGPTDLLHAVAAGLAWLALGLEPVAILGDSVAAACLRGEASLDEALAHVIAGEPLPGRPPRVPASARGYSVSTGLGTREEVLRHAAALFVAGRDLDLRALVGPGPRVPLPPHLLRRRTWRSPLLDDDLAAAPATPGEDTLHVLTEIVAVGPDEPLADLGLDSVRLVELIGALQARGLHVFPDELAGATTLRELAARLDRPATTAPDVHRIVEILDRRTSPPPQPVAERLDPVVFLLSAPRSGSTLLRAMLAGHPALFAPPELHLLGHADLAARADALGPTMLDRGLHHALVGAGLPAEEAVGTVERWVAERAPPTTAYARLQQLTAGRVLVDKTPAYALDAGALQAAEAWFDRPRYLLLTRDPDAMVASFARNRLHRLLGDVDPHLAGEQVWLRAAGHLDALIDGDRSHHVRFEDLVRTPEPVLRRICAFLELPWDPAVLDPWSGERMLDVHVGDPGFRTRTRIEPGLAEAPPLPLDEPTRQAAQRLGHGYDELPAGFFVAEPTLRGRILLTGATGFLGGHLLQALRERTDAEILCLVRAPDLAEARRRLPGAEVVLGDLDDVPDVEVDTVVHAAGVVSFGLPYAALRGPNVLGTQRMLMLAARCGARFHHVSSKGVLDVARWPGSGLVSEDAPLRPPTDVLAYQRSKWAAERLVHQAIDHGLRACISRPGRIGPDASGHVPQTDFLVRFLLACRRAGALPDLDLPLEVVPVDHVAAAIADLVLQDEPPRVCHLTHPEPLELAEVQALLGLPSVPFEAWRQQVLALPDSPLAGLLEWIEGAPRRIHEGRLSVARAREATGWDPPPVAEILGRML